MHPSSLSLLAIAMLAVGCNSLRGNGRVVSESRTEPPFTRVAVSGGIHAIIDVGPTAHLEVLTDQNLQGELITQVNGGTLSVSWNGPVSPTEAVVTMGLPSLEQLDLSGGSPAEATHLAGANFQLGESGGSKATLSGSVGRFTVDASGASQVAGDSLAADAVVVDGSGASALSLQANQSLQATLSGASSLQVARRPAQVSQDLSGGSSLTFGM
jgi:hypothetical protein